VFADFLLNQSKNDSNQEYDDQANLCNYYLDSFLNALDYLYNESNVTSTNDFKRQLREIFM
jgi:hypothetical protein